MESITFAILAHLFYKMAHNENPGWLQVLAYLATLSSVIGSVAGLMRGA